MIINSKSIFMMKKTVLSLILMLSCFLGSMNAQEPTVVSDTVRCAACDSIYLPQPTDDKHRVVTNKFKDNWFILGGVGIHAFSGDYSEVYKYSGFISPDFTIGAGKWFTPGIGAKLQFGIGNSRGYSKEWTPFTYGDRMVNGAGIPFWKSNNKWLDVNASVMFNLSRLFSGYEGKDSDRLMNQFIASVGIGALHHWGIEEQRNEWSGHFELQYSRFFDKKKSISLDLKAQTMLYQTNFDGVELKSSGENSAWFDINYGLSLGVTYYFKKRHWDRCVPSEKHVYNVTRNVIMPVPVNDCPEYGVMEFYVFFPNNYSGCDDAPVAADAQVNAIDYLASGIFTQKRFEDTDAVASRLAAGASLKGLKTVDIPTAEFMAMLDSLNAEDSVNMRYGYEMTASPVSLSMDAESMNAFKEKTGYYYAPVYSGNNTWYYRIDNETGTQRLVADANYKETQSFSLNAHEGLEMVRKYMNYNYDADLYSFADVYGAIDDNGSCVAESADSATVKRIEKIFADGKILYVVAEGFATSQDNFIGEDAENIGLERNRKLAFNRAYTVVQWLKGNSGFENLPDDYFAINALNDPIIRVDDDSVQGLNAKMRRCVKVRIHYVID